MGSRALHLTQTTSPSSVKMADIQQQVTEEVNNVVEKTEELTVEDVSEEVATTIDKTEEDKLEEESVESEASESVVAESGTDDKSEAVAGQETETEDEEKVM